MNIIQVKIDFEQGTCQKQGISVVTGDYNSTKVVFEFNESATGTKIFKMKDPNDNLVYADEIVNNEIILVGQEDVKDDNGYIKYLDINDNVYWYDSANDVIYNSNYEETTGVELDTLIKQTKIASLFGEEGDYTFEVSLYQNNGKLTSVCDYITANKEQVIVDGEEVQEQITLFDNLMNELATAIVETNNLDLDAEKVGTTTTITITKKDGTPKETEILDGEDGTSLESIEIKDRDLYVTYGGSESDLGQIVPNIQVGTTTTGLPSTPASVVNVGTDLNPIFNFTIPKGDAGAIKIKIVEELPLVGEEDTFYLVPYDILTVEELPSEGLPDTIYIVSSTNKRYVYESGQWIEIASDNRYKEYIWANNNWERLGQIGIEVDLTDYVKNTDYATSNKGGVFKTGFGIQQLEGTIAGETYTYSDYQGWRDLLIVSKGTLDNVLDARIGDIQTLLDNLDVGGGV